MGKVVVEYTHAPPRLTDMQIRRRSHPVSPQKSSPGTNVGGWRMRRKGSPLWNSAGDVIDPEAIQAKIVAATKAKVGAVPSGRDPAAS